MSVFIQLVRLTVVSLVVLIVFISKIGAISNYDVDYLVQYVTTPRKQQLYEPYSYIPYGPSRTDEPWVVLCARGRGICVSSQACPWAGIIADTLEDCLAYGNHGACCQVTPARMPVDMFEMYDM